MNAEEQPTLPFIDAPDAARLDCPKVWVLAAAGPPSPQIRRAFFIDPLSGAGVIAAGDVVMLRRNEDDYLLYADPRNEVGVEHTVDVLTQLGPTSAPTFTRAGPIVDLLCIGFTPGRADDPVVQSNVGQISARTHFEQLLFTVARRLSHSAACAQAARTLDLRNQGQLHDGIAAIVERERADALLAGARADRPLTTHIAPWQYYQSSWVRFGRLGLVHQQRSTRRAATMTQPASEQMMLPGFETGPPATREPALGYAIRRACGFPLAFDAMGASARAAQPKGTGYFQLAGQLRLPDRQVAALLSGASSPYRKVAVEVTPRHDGFALEVGAQDEMNQMLGRPLACESQAGVHLITVACDTLEFDQDPVTLQPKRAASFLCRPKGCSRHDVQAAVTLKSGAQLSLRFLLANRPKRQLTFA